MAKNTINISDKAMIALFEVKAISSMAGKNIHKNEDLVNEGLLLLSDLISLVGSNEVVDFLKKKREIQNPNLNF